MAKVVLADSGFIVAAMDRRDQHHAWAQMQFASLGQPCITCEAVLSESFFLIEHLWGGKAALCSLIEKGIIRVEFDAADYLGELVRLIRRYADTPMSFADACLVRMSEIHKSGVVFTTDSDFKIYRRHGRQVIPVVAPW